MNTSDASAAAFRLAAASFTAAHESLIATMRLCQESNQASGATAGEVATSYLISLKLAASLLKPGPVPDVDGVSLRGQFHLAQLICDIVADPRGASSVLRSDVLGPATVQIAVKSPAETGFVQYWNQRASELGIELNWARVEFAMPDVIHIRDRLASGDGGPPLQIDSTAVTTSGVEYVVTASDADINMWRVAADWPAWAALIHSSAKP